MEYVCRNCKYFIAHYVKEYSCYMSIGGHCINNDFKAERKRKPFDLQTECVFWERDDRKEKRLKSIRENLNSIAERLNDIYCILNDDE